MNNRQAKWSREEACVLLVGYLAHKRARIPKKDIIIKVSRVLRAYAIATGISIDLAYRNEVGIAFQLAGMDSAFQGRRIFKPASTMFTETVKLYHRDNDSFWKYIYNVRKSLNNAGMQEVLLCDELKNAVVREDMVDSNLSSNNDDSTPAVEEYSFVHEKLREALKQLTMTEGDGVSVSRLQMEMGEAIDLNNLKEILDNSSWAEKDASGIFYKYKQEEYLKEENEYNKVSFLPIDNNQRRSKRLAVEDSQESMDFLDWLISEAGLATITSRGYVSAVHCIERLLEEERFEKTKLFGASLDDVMEIAAILRDNEKFMAANETQHNRLRSGLNQYIQYLGGDSPLKRIKKTVSEDGVSWSTRVAVDDSEESLEFYEWLITEAGLAAVTARGYVSAVHCIEKLLEDEGFERTELFGADLDEVIGIATSLRDSEKFMAANETQHNRLRSGLNQYIKFLGGESPLARQKKSVDEDAVGRSTRVSINNSEESIAFYEWLIDQANVAPVTARGYVSAVHCVEKLLMEEQFENTELFGANLEVVSSTVEALIANKKFQDANESQHNRLRSGLSQYIKFLGGDSPFKRIRKTQANGSNGYATRVSISDSEESSAFFDWMINDNGMSLSTARSYASAIHNIESLLVQQGSYVTDIYGNDTESILETYDFLAGNEAFVEANNSQHNRLRNSLFKYIAFLGGEPPRERRVNDLNGYTTRVSIKDSEESSAFFDWMINDNGMSLSTARSYASAIHNIESFLKQQGSYETDIYGNNAESILEMYEVLAGNEAFIEANISQHNRLRNSLFKYVEFLGGEPPRERRTTRDSQRKSSDEAFAYPSEESAPNDFDKDKFEEVLSLRYGSGLLFDSIDLDNFRLVYENMFGEEIEFTDEDLEKRLRYCGFIYNGRLFSVGGVIDPDTKQEVFAYIKENFESGKKIVYYKSIFEDLSSVLSSCFNLIDEYMLAALIAYSDSAHQYYYFNDYLANEKEVRVDYAAEIADCLLQAGKPLSYDEIYEQLSYLSQEVIHREIRANDKFIVDSKEHYFHIDIFEFDSSDKDRIKQLIDEQIRFSGYAVWGQIYDEITITMPIFMEHNAYLSKIGIRNAVTYYLCDEYSIDGAIISSKGNKLAMSDVFKSFALQRESFSSDELKDFADELSVGLALYYLYAVMEVAVRVSKDLYVNKKNVVVDTDEIDAAIETYFSNEYIPISLIDSFLVFPSVGFEWNEFLLESYLLSYSKKFMLVSNGINTSNVSGAIVKRDNNAVDFCHICAKALSESHIELNETDALDYLVANGLLSKRSYKDIEKAVNEAKRIRNMKG